MNLAPGTSTAQQQQQQQQQQQMVDPAAQFAEVRNSKHSGESVPVYDGIPFFGSPPGKFFQIV